MDRPIDRERVLDAIEDALEDGALGDGLALCNALLRRDPEDPDAMALKADILCEGGHFETALCLYETVCELVPSFVAGDTRRASVLLELGRLDEAAALADHALGRAPDHGDAHQIKAIVCELQGDEVGAARHFRRAFELDPWRCPPFRVSEDAFFALATEAWEQLSSALVGELQNLNIRVRPFPRVEWVQGDQTPLSMLVLGYFEGPTHADHSAGLALVPSHIFLFQKNHERMCRSHSELAAQVAITLRHEIGHYLGLDEEAVANLGLA